MHFTYEDRPRQDLQQGDVITRTEAVEALLKQVPPHYCVSQSYRYFLVLTQSCDLVRREGKTCNARYITIAAIRPLRTVVEREVQKLQYSDIERRLGFCSTERQSRLTQFMERLLNNNEEEYFYLHREPSAGFPEDHCCFLQLSIALRAHEHYQTLLAARILSLKQSFQHKLGYLVGTLYSRIGTEDWLERAETATRYRDLAQEPLRDSDLVLWLEKDIHKAVLKALKRYDVPTPEDLEKAIDEAQQLREKGRSEVLGIIGSVLSDLHVPEDTIKRVKARLENRPEFAQRFR